jgi:uncharacterized GH25 family protein
LRTCHLSILLIGCLLLPAVAVHAHDVTAYPIVEGKDVRLDLYYGDPGDYQPIDKIKFVELAVYDGSGQRISFLRDIERPASDPKKLTTPKLRLGDWPGGTCVVSGRYDNGFFIHDEENRAVSTTRDWFPSSIDSAHYRKFVKSLFHVNAPGPGYDRELGHRLELIPRADPFASGNGGTLPVEIRFDGKPLANHLLEVGDQTAASRGNEVRTNDRGIALVPLTHAGVYRLAVDHRVPSPYPELYAYDDYTASLVFERSP